MGVIYVGVVRRRVYRGIVDDLPQKRGVNAAVNSAVYVRNAVTQFDRLGTYWRLGADERTNPSDAAVRNGFGDIDGYRLLKPMLAGAGVTKFAEFTGSGEGE